MSHPEDFWTNNQLARLVKDKRVIAWEAEAELFLRGGELLTRMRKSDQRPCLRGLSQCASVQCSTSQPQPAPRMEGLSVKNKQIMNSVRYVAAPWEKGAWFITLDARSRLPGPSLRKCTWLAGLACRHRAGTLPRTYHVLDAGMPLTTRQQTIPSLVAHHSGLVPQDSLWKSKAHARAPLPIAEPQ